MRKLPVFVFFCSICMLAESQNLTVEGTAPDIYITHTVAPKENFYSIGRNYNQPAKSIASYNNITMDKGLTVGQQVKIPLTAQNLESNGSSMAGEALIPLTHIVAKSETLFKISSNLGVTAQSIRKWNNLSSDKIAPGTPLIVGYLKTSNAKFLAGIKNNTGTAKSNEASDQKSEAETEKQVSTEGAEKSQETSTPVAAKDTALAVIPEEPAGSGSLANEPIKDEPVKQQETSIKNDESKRISQPNESSSSPVTGSFEDIFKMQASEKSENTKSGEAATFKSTSGWQDKKYYILINDVAPGTIVKISSTDNKTVYAKVLGSMPEMKENNGLLLRISNAAASYLGIIDPKFPVQISYYQ